MSATNPSGLLLLLELVFLTGWIRLDPVTCSSRNELEVSRFPTAEVLNEEDFQLQQQQQSQQQLHNVRVFRMKEEEEEQDGGGARGDVEEGRGEKEGKKKKKKCPKHSKGTIYALRKG